MIVTDDQPTHTMGYLPFTKSFFRTRYNNAYVSNPSCCPSRTSILTGTFSYTNNVWTNESGYGGWPAFSANGWEDRSIPTLLQQHGYRTGLFGKFLNDWDDRIPIGWDVMAAHATSGVRGPGSPYYNYSLIHADGTYEDHLDAPEDYSTDVLTERAKEFISSTIPSQPEFLYFSVNAPHSADGIGGSQPPIPAPRHLDAPVVPEPFLSPNFREEDVSDKPAYVRKDQKGDMRSAAYYHRWMDRAARSLYSVDEGIQAIVRAQRARDPGLHNTIFLFMSDNGHLTGAHGRLGKGVPYEEAIRVPLMVRSDGIGPGTVHDIVMNVDVAPTIVEAAGITSVPWSIEGGSLFHVAPRPWAFIEGAADAHPFCGIANRNEKIVRYASGEWEYYDLRDDPFELVSEPAAPGALALRDTASQACEGKLPPMWPRSGL